MKPTVAQLESQLVCQTFAYANCSHVELRRFYAYIDWARLMSSFRNQKFSGKTLAATLDSITVRAKNYKLKMGGMRSAGISIYGKFISYLNGYLNVANGTKLLCFNSSRLRVDCETVTFSDTNGSFTRYNFTFYLPKAGKLKLSIKTAEFAKLTNG